jgi:hypothetical protein
LKKIKRFSATNSIVFLGYKEIKLQLHISNAANEDVLKVTKWFNRLQLFSADILLARRNWGL